MRTDAQLSYYSIPNWVEGLNDDNCYTVDKNWIYFDGIWHKLYLNEDGTIAFKYSVLINIKGKPVRHETEITVIL